jgi:hypothetical protein
MFAFVRGVPDVTAIGGTNGGTRARDPVTVPQDGDPPER